MKDHQERSKRDRKDIHKAWQDLAEKAKQDDIPKWDEFTQNTTFHGIKYIFDSEGASPLRR